MVKVINLAQKAPPMIAGNDQVKSLQSLAQKMLGAGKEVVQPPISQNEPESMSSQVSFWGNAQNLVAIDLAIQRRLEYIKEVSDMPSLNLGFTPTPLDVGKCSWANVANIVAHCTPQKEDQQHVGQGHQEVSTKNNDKGKVVPVGVEVPALMQQQIQRSKSASRC